MRVNRKSLLAAGAVAVVATLGLAGCAGSDSGSDAESTTSGKLTVWVDSERVDALQGAADAYTEKTGVKVDLVGKDVADIKDDFIQQVPTGKGPDIVMGAHDWLGELSTNGVVAPLELGDSAGDYLPVAIDASTYEGTVYMLPYAVENIAMLRNADLIPEPASSFDDMLAKGKAAGLDHPFVVEQGAEGNPYHLYPYQTAFGAPVFGSGAEGYNPDDLQLGNTGGEQFATWLGSQGKNGTGAFNTDIDGDIAKEAFTSGKAAFWLTGPWNVGAAVDAGINVAIDPIPSPTSEAAQPFAGVKGFFVSAESKNKVAANDFLVNYLGTEDVQLSLFEAGNILPALSAAAETASSDPIIAGFA
ncbi:MAG TPA: extracellular solute-binding protein, partial [Agromyces sp.]